jgi:hypothetical protein
VLYSSHPQARLRGPPLDHHESHMQSTLSKYEHGGLLKPMLGFMCGITCVVVGSLRVSASLFGESLTFFGSDVWGKFQVVCLCGCAELQVFL